MTNKLGIMIAGVGGAVGSTVAAGIALMRRGLTLPRGMLTELETMPKDGVFGAGTDLVRDALGIATFADTHVGGWDVGPPVAFEKYVGLHHVVPPELQHTLVGVPDVAHVYPAWTCEKGAVWRKGATNESFQSWGHAAEAIRADIRDFRTRHGLDQVVVVCLLPTRPTIPQEEAHQRIGDFETLLDTPSAVIAADMVYLYAAIKESCAWVNFTPNVAEVPALVEFAVKNGIPMAGRDGKTGQTLVKTALAPVFRARHLRVRGWFSTNILGNRDGMALRDPGALSSKLFTKASGLESILGYQVGDDEPSHVVTIHYYPPRGDAKEAWDAIDLEGFLGVNMSVKINFLCKDSILAAPLIIDLARLANVAKQRGERGFLGWLSAFFKFPLGPEGEPTVHHFFQQMHALATHVEKARL